MTTSVPGHLQDFQVVGNVFEPKSVRRTQMVDKRVRREVGMKHVHHLRLLTCEGIGFKKLIPPRFAGHRIVGGGWWGRIVVWRCF